MLMSFISWWYGKGLGWKAEKILDSIEHSMDTFSLGLLAKTWFSPFRQIDANSGANLPLDAQIRKFFDKLISRIIGAMLRSVVMVVGVGYISAKAIFGIFQIFLWIIMPILPIVFVVFFTMNLTPNILPKIKTQIQKTQKAERGVR